MPNTRYPRKRKKRRSALSVPLSFIVICAAIVFGMSVFFRVSKIEVSGATQYSEAEIIEASGIESGDNLFFLNRFTAISRLYSKLPYVEEAQINRVFPNKVIITVNESVKIAYVHAETELWAIDRKCKLLEKISHTEAYGLIEVAGLTPAAPGGGAILTVGEEEGIKVGYLADILDAIQSRDMQGDVRRIDMSNPANPSFEYLDRFIVKLGANDSTSYKFEALLGAIQKLSPNDAGTIDLSIKKEVHFSPD